MATNFFQQQDSARRKTFQLVVYFVLAFLILIALVYGLLVALSMYGAHEPVSWWQPDMLLLAAPAVGILVGGASALKVAQLASGGQAVALMLGGKEVPGTTTDARQKRLLNVVEEMALAAGVPVPPVYVLPETGINAFAAGYAPGDAVVAVSQGCLDYLTRDELQGVVAHEFSHILNGDMRLNIRLIGLIFGIMALSIIGRSPSSCRSVRRVHCTARRKNWRVPAGLPTPTARDRRTGGYTPCSGFLIADDPA
ncbi:M48 family metalloprotease [Paraburkholderia sp. 35.1]|uniref:M48 family metalloprotease n=1 Tax=Paraburkholderia sp. 35.1 TaxID=2991058 RepID=UPI003D1F86A0